MIHLLKTLWRNESGFIVSAELVTIATLLVIGLVTGLSCVQKAMVQEPIKPGAPGVVKVHGENWRAVSEEGLFDVGSWVVVEKIEGASVIVRRGS